MKKSLLALVALSVMAFGVDYSAMSATELAALRGTVPTEDRAVFQAAMQALSPDERTTLTGARTSNPGTGSMGANAGGAGGGAGAGKSGGNGKGGRN